MTPIYQNLKPGDKILGRVVMCPRIDIHSKHDLMDKITVVETDVTYTVKEIYPMYLIVDGIFDGKEFTRAIGFHQIYSDKGQIRAL